MKLAFLSYGGIKIDVNSVRVFNLRTPDVDIATRIKPFVSPIGIDLRAATIPPGEHLLRFEIKDANRRILHVREIEPIRGELRRRFPRIIP